MGYRRVRYSYVLCRAWGRRGGHCLSTGACTVAKPSRGKKGRGRGRLRESQTGPSRQRRWPTRPLSLLHRPDSHVPLHGRRAAWQAASRGACSGDLGPTWPGLARPGALRWEQHGPHRLERLGSTFWAQQRVPRWELTGPPADPAQPPPNPATDKAGRAGRGSPPPGLPPELEVDTPPSAAFWLCRPRRAGSWLEGSGRRERRRTALGFLGPTLARSPGQPEFLGSNERPPRALSWAPSPGVITTRQGWTPGTQSWRAEGEPGPGSEGSLWGKEQLSKPRVTPSWQSPTLSLPSWAQTPADQPLPCT